MKIQIILGLMNKGTIELKSGNSVLNICLPQNLQYQVLEIAETKSNKSKDDIIRDAIDNPIGSEKIEKILKPGQKVCIISDDNTRFTPVKEILSELLPRIESAGILREDIFIVFALGSHRYMTEAEMIEKVGSDVFKKYQVFNSEFMNPKMQVTVGESQFGTPIRVHKKAMEADIRIGIGNVVPHGCMGFSGGAKILYPGITSEDIVSEFHAMQATCDEILYGNMEAPTRIAVENWTKMIGLDFIINTVLDRENELFFAVSGDYILAQREAAKKALEMYGAKIKKRPDIIITSSFPLYLDFWQCGKAAYGPASVIKEGGEIFLFCECREGVGPHKKILEYMGLESGKEEILKRISNHEMGEDMLAMAVGVSMGKIASSCSLTLVTNGLSDEECREGKMGHLPIETFDNNLKAILEEYEDPFVLIIKEGSEIIPKL